MFRLVPPAGVPVPVSALAAATMRRLGATDCAAEFRARLRELTGSRHCFLLNSGRTAMALGLAAMHELDRQRRREVIIPAYTCFSVPAAIVRAGLTLRVVDVDPNTLDYDYGQLERTCSSATLAVVGCNLFGVLSDWQRLREVAASVGCYLVDDAAQSMGTTLDSVASGSMGDFGVFSLGRGKNLSTYSGGVLLTDSDELAQCVDSRLSSLPQPTVTGEIPILIKMALYAVLLRPLCYWIPANIPFLGLGETLFEPDILFGRLSPWQCCLGVAVIGQLPRLNETRSQIARQLIEGLAGSEYSVPGSSRRPFPSYLRLPVMCRDRSVRDRLIAELRLIGVVASGMYPSPVLDIPGIERYTSDNNHNCPGAREVTERLLTLPTHPYVNRADTLAIVSLLTGK